MSEQLEVEEVIEDRETGEIAIELNRASTTSYPETRSITLSKCGYTLDELKQLLIGNPVNYVVDGLLPADDVHVAVGDSGLGKTPWAYQLGLCIASGKPFLGHNVRKARVVYYDLENGYQEIVDVSSALCRHLGIGPSPKEFIVIPNDGNPPPIENAVTIHKPSLIIVDTLRALHPEAEMDNSRMGVVLRKLRAVAREQHCAILLLHHTRKPGESGIAGLGQTPIIEWLNEAAGARSLINQTNARIGLERPRMGAREDVALVMKSHVKVRGESGLYHLERICDTAGDPVGYDRIHGVDLLCNPEQEDACRNLPPRFTFGEAKRIYGKTDNPTRQWLKKCDALGLVKQLGRGEYERRPEREPSKPILIEVAEGSD